jgi:hypothetical protein
MAGVVGMSRHNYPDQDKERRDEGSMWAFMLLDARVLLEGHENETEDERRAILQASGQFSLPDVETLLGMLRRET